MTVGTASTGWETFLYAVIRAGFSVSGTWPMRTERHDPTRRYVQGSNALASSIVLVCRPLAADAPTATRREFRDALKSGVARGAAQDAAGQYRTGGPGPSRHRTGDGHLHPLRPGAGRQRRGCICPRGSRSHQRDLGRGVGGAGRETSTPTPAGRWLGSSSQASAKGEYGVAETLSTAKNTSVAGMVEAGILTSGGGNVRLLAPAELPQDWNPKADSHRTVWETTHHLVRVHEQGGDDGRCRHHGQHMGADAETARDLAYRLYRICDLRNRPQEALGYNALVRSWGEISGLATQARQAPTEPNMFDGE